MLYVPSEKMYCDQSANLPSFYPISPSSFPVSPAPILHPPSPLTTDQATKKILTLAKKFDTVHKNTTTNNSAIPSVRRATPPSPSLALMLPLDFVLTADVWRDSEAGSLSAVKRPIVAAAAPDCDLRREWE